MKILTFKLILVFCLIILVESIFVYNVYSQDLNHKDILNRIDSEDTIEALTALEQALDNPNQIIRKIGLEKGLKSNDRRVRELSLGFLAKHYKKFHLEFVFPETLHDKMIKTSGYYDKLIEMNPIVYCTSNEFEDDGSFKGNCYNIGDFTGLISNGKMRLTFPNPICCAIGIVDLDKVVSGYLVGAFFINNFSFSVKRPLP